MNIWLNQLTAHIEFPRFLHTTVLAGLARVGKSEILAQGSGFVAQSESPDQAQFSWDVYISNELSS